MRTKDTPLSIMKVIKLALVALAFISQVAVYASYAPYVHIPKKLSSEYGTIYTREEILEVVLPVAEKYNVSSERMMYTIEKESRFRNIQSGCHKNEYTNCGNYGVRELSWGAVQFHESTLSKEEALDPYIAIDKMGYYFSIGEACRWTEYKLKYGCK